MNFYEKLGLSRTATSKDIKKAYKALVKKYHPDVFDGSKDIAEAKIKEINEAYDTLSVPELKEKYDRSLDESETVTAFNPDDYDTSESEVQKRYKDFEHRYENIYKYGKYTTNYYGVSHNTDFEKEKVHANNRPVQDSDFFGGSRSVFIIGIACIALFLLISIIFLLSYAKEALSKPVDVSSSPTQEYDVLPVIDFDMSYVEVTSLLGDPDTTKLKSNNTYAYWGDSYIIFDKNNKVTGWKNEGDFSTDAYTGAESKFIKELYNSINSSYDYNY